MKSINVKYVIVAVLWDNDTDKVVVEGTPTIGYRGASTLLFLLYCFQFLK